MRNLAAAPTNTLSTFELVALVAAMTALNALSIDIMLPALPDIGTAFNVANENDRQLVVIAYVSIFGIAQLVYGPLTDAIGRRPVLIWTLALYAIGSLLCLFAGSFTLFLLARALQGTGAAATRVIASAVVRDLTDGRRMAQIMSMAMTAFMIVPIIAPGLGQLILLVAPWKWIFGALLIYAGVVFLWLLFRLPETLAPEKRQPLNPRGTLALYARVIANRQTLGYTLAATFSSASLFAYIVSAQQIFVDVYGLGANFPIAFAGVALVMSFGNILNARVVMRLGMRRIAHGMSVWLTLVAALNAATIYFGAHSFWLFIILFALTLGVFGMLSANFNALAMQPAGFGAGSAAALFGAITTIGGSLLGAMIGRAFDGTPLPFLLGIALLGIAILITLFWTERGRLFQEPPNA